MLYAIAVPAARKIEIGAFTARLVLFPPLIRAVALQKGERPSKARVIFASARPFV